MSLPAKRPSFRDLARYPQDGISDPFDIPVLRQPGFVDRLTRGYEALCPNLAFPGPGHQFMASRLDQGALWFHSSFTVLREAYELATDPAILERVVAILGEDVLLWGIAVLTKQPGEIHGWHVDSNSCETVGVFTGLRGTSRKSSVRAITGSQKFREEPMDLLTGGQFQTVRGGKELADEQRVLQAARTVDSGATLAVPDMTDGQGYIFHGRIWHGSHNESDVARTAATLFYTRPSERALIPTTFGNPRTWYEKPAPCILVHGKDTHGINRLVEPPPAS